MPDTQVLAGPDSAVVSSDAREDLEQVCAVARAHAEAVDREGRFPAETIAALRVRRQLAALVPVASGGLGLAVRDVAATCYALGRCCASSAMVLAMHHIQVAALVDHSGDSVWLRDFLRRVGRDGLLLASVTSEVGTGGSMRTSLCAVESGEDGRWNLLKRASTVSYGAWSDALLVTARANPEAEQGNQVLVVVPNDAGVLTRTGGWDSMGMRGTCSEAFVVGAHGEPAQILPTPFATIAAESMVPVSHLFWASLWCGIAADAVTRARLFLRAKMRGTEGGIPDGAARLVVAVEMLQSAEARVRQMLERHALVGAGQSFADAAAFSMLKTSVSEACLAVVGEALLVCGFAGYANTGPFSLSRHLRDLHSARLMIHNDRVRANTARALLLQAPMLGVI